MYVPRTDLAKSLGKEEKITQYREDAPPRSDRFFQI
jgi:hypothetical protein